MRLFATGVGIFLLTLFVAILHYTLPQRDIVRITGTEIIRADFSGMNRVFYANPDSGNLDRTNRDLRLINTAYPNGGVMVFRNEDTGFSWPFYFKFDSSNLQAEAADLESNKAEPTYAIVRHYGWRNELFSIYPNAVSVREIDDPNMRLIPWFNIVFLILLGLVLLGIFRLWQRFKRRRIDPVVDQVGETWDRVEDRATDAQGSVTGFFGRINRFLARWFGSR